MANFYRGTLQMGCLHLRDPTNLVFSKEGILKKSVSIEETIQMGCFLMGILQMMCFYSGDPKNGVFP